MMKNRKKNQKKNQNNKLGTKISLLNTLTLPPRDESSDSVSSDSESEGEEVELSTTQAEIALLKSKNKIGKKERKLLDHDLGDVERTLSIVLERLKVLESGENATLKKKLAEKEMKFYMEMVYKGVVPKPSSKDGSTEHPRMKSKKPSSDGTEGPSEPRGPPSDSQ
nr:hypothetical protein [Tanacetum cinerariifolium]